MKICIGCGEDKPLSDYYDTTHQKGGKFGRCKQCVKEHQRKDRSENIERFRENERNRKARSRERIAAEENRIVDMPKDVEVYLDGSYYKVGARGFLYYHNGDEWIRSCKTSEDMDIALGRKKKVGVWM